MTAGTPTPVVTGTVIAAVSFSISKGIAKISLGSGALPTNGYNGPNGYPTNNGTTGSTFDIHGGVSGFNNAGGANRGGNSAGGQQVTLWHFTTATYFNGKTITVLDCDPSTNSFRFYFNHADVGVTSDAGNTAAAPVQAYRVVRLVWYSTGTDFIYVGDGNVSSTQYIEVLSASGQHAVEIASDNIRADRIFIDGTENGDSVQVSVIY